MAYDTAWAARVTDESGKPLFPECIRWLLENQKPDGSWGCEIVNYHDRILSTLSAVTALKEIGGRRYSKWIQRGETYIWENLENITLDRNRFIGSELLLPSLMEQAEVMGLNLPYHIKIYEREHDMKLKRIDESLWYSPLTTLSFSLEFLGDTVNVERLANVQLPNGSVATSPAATAFFLTHKKDAKAYLYLRKILSLTGDGSMMTVYPIEVFEYGWILHNLMLAGLYFERYTEICDFLLNNLGPLGVGWSTELPITDADDTALACKALYKWGYPVDFRVFDAYNMGEHYLAFAFELDSSVSTNIHVLDFVKNCSTFPDREEVMERLIRFLKKKMNPEGFWVDKWHVSPYYSTSHALCTLCDVDPSLAEKAVSWTLKYQNENGMWGEQGGTLEETAYAVQALMYYHRHVGRIDLARLFQPVAVLNCKGFVPLSAPLRDLWISKVLYTPIRVVWSSVASAQFMVRAENLQSTLTMC